MYNKVFKLSKKNESLFFRINHDNKILLNILKKRVKFVVIK